MVQIAFAFHTMVVSYPGPTRGVISALDHRPYGMYDLRHTIRRTYVHFVVGQNKAFKASPPYHSLTKAFVNQSELLANEMLTNGHCFTAHIATFSSDVPDHSI